MSAIDTGRMGPDLPPAVPGVLHELKVDGVGFVLYARESGPVRDPILLIHSVNAAASAFEVRPIYEGLTNRSVYALDLPGFGRAQRPDIRYTPELMTSAIHAATAWIRRRGAGLPIDALAVSLSSEFLARAAGEDPSAYRTLAFVAATGLEGRRGPVGATLGKPIVRRVLTCSWWSRGLFRLLTRPRIIRFFLRKTWGRKAIDEGLQAYCEASTQVSGAEHAPISFLSGELFSADASLLYEALQLPVLSCYGVRGDFAGYGSAESLQTDPHWHMQRFETGALPHFEVPAEFIARYERFLVEPDA